MPSGNEVAVTVSNVTPVTVTVPGSTGTTPTITNGGTANVTVTSVGDRGPKGDTGPATTLTIGTVTKGTDAAASISGTAPNQVLSLTLPQGNAGQAGPATSIVVGKTTTLTAGSKATVTATTSSDGSTVTLDFGLPPGDAASLSDATPVQLGTAASGTAASASRADHVHPIPTATDIGALDASSDVDGGDYVGVIVNPTPAIQITSQPSNQSVKAGGVNEISSTLPAGTWGASSRVNSQWFVGGNQTTQADYIAKSSDGLAWTKQSNLPAVGRWSPMQYQNGVYAMQAGNVVAYSSDAANWSGSTISFSRGGVFGAAGRFVRATETAIYYSTDGQSWSQASGSHQANTAYFGYANSTYFAALGSTMRTSTNGTTWDSLGGSFFSDIEPTNGTILSPAVFGGSVYFGRSNNRPARYSSGSWSSVAITGAGGGQIATDGTVLVFYGYTNSSSSAPRGIIWTSVNGTTWVERPLPISIPSGRVATLFYAGGQFVLLFHYGIQDGAIVPNTQGTIYFTSTDGVTWTQGTRAKGTLLSTTNFFNSTTYADQVNGEWRAYTFGGSTASATFGLSAFYSAGQISYQWQSSTDAGTTWANISGATLPTLTLTGLTSADSGKRYRAVLSATGASTVNSNSATLTVT